ncbi:spore germination protein GerPE [Paenibacillus sp. 1P07SE]|uniref:spore germination protein GerPE n=1 Tax=Paenibacillus sp. 1P07SE TaxID=3132209 RepID=UPI0039A4FA83
MIADGRVRTARLGQLTIINVSLSGIVQLGDHDSFTPIVRAIAVQRQEDHLTAGEASFASYPFFTRPFPLFPLPPAGANSSESLAIDKLHLSPDIHVGSISVIGVGSSSLVQAGNGRYTRAESRVKHIRQFRDPAHPLPAQS